ncbi:hypothetical protein BC941DRAFT_410945 [Chlamydoabsidia padenii]|nr:hypothetical protein BC941DRAFT_410945 [Chlamydoabsidia padenii]
MIFKFWNIRLADTLHTDNLPNGGEMTTSRLKKHQAAMERKVNRIWSDLSSFEESSAACISDMLLLVAAGAYVEGFRMASQFVMHLEVLYNALDDIKQQLIPHDKVLPCGNEAKTICHQVMRFFNLLAQSDDKKINSTKGASMGVTQELLGLVTSLAQNLKTLIRIGLTEVLFLERDHQVSDAIPRFLNNLLELDRKRVWVGGRYWFKEDPVPKLLDPTATTNFTNMDNSDGSTTTLCTNQHQEKTWDLCYSCRQTIDKDCFQHANLERWHPSCFTCSKCQHPFAKDLLSARYLSINTSTARVLLCNQCATDIIVTGQSAHQDTTTCSFIHLTQLQHYLYLLKLSLSRLYLVMNSSSVKLDERLGIYAQQNLNKKQNISITNALTTPSVGFLPMTKDHHGNHITPSKEKQQKPTRRTSLLGSIYLGNIKRVKSTRRDRLTTPSPETAVVIAPIRPSPTVLDEATTTRQQTSSVNDLSPSPVKHQQNQWHEHESEPSTSIQQHSHRSMSPPPQPGSSGIGVLSATKRASTNTIQRISSLRRAFSQRGGPDRNNSLLDRRQHQQRPIDEPTSIFTNISREPQQISSMSSSSPSLLMNSTTPTPKSTSLYQHLLPLSPNQYLIVSYLAAKTIGTLLHDMYTLDKWMQLVDCRKTTLWGKLKHRIKASHQTSSADQQQLPQQQPQQKVFGVPLSLLTSVTCRYDYQQRKQTDTFKRYSGTIQNDNNAIHYQADEGARSANQGAIQWMISCFTSIHCKVPPFIQHCIMALLQRDMRVEGIFRKNGNVRELNQMEEIIDQDCSSDYSTTIDLLAKQSSIQLAAVLKRYLRALPEPLLTYRLYPVFVAAIGLDAEDQIKPALHLACCMLPKENRDTMQVIFGFLHHVSTFHNMNKMGIYNLARIMAPSVLHDRSTTNGINNHQETSPNNNSTVVDRTPNEEIRVVEMLIKCHAEFGKTPTEMISLISDHPMVEWFATMDAKQFVKHFDDINQPPHPLRTQPSSVPTLSPTDYSNPPTPSPSPSSHHPFMMGGRRRSSLRAASTSPIKSSPFDPSNAPSPISSLSTTSKIFQRTSWILRKQQA